MDLGGLAVTFLDTAGVRYSEDEIEAAGIERAKARARAADLRVYMDDSAQVYGLPVEAGDLLLHGKCDLGRGPGLNVSGKTGEGLDDMLASVCNELERRAAGGGLATRDRHRRALVAAVQHAEAALERLESSQIELVADDLRAARHELDVLVGRVDVEEILGHIFSSFCSGK
jgi:tRNA modification GTPase